MELLKGRLLRDKIERFGFLPGVIGLAALGSVFFSSNKPSNPPPSISPPSIRAIPSPTPIPKISDPGTGERSKADDLLDLLVGTGKKTLIASLDHRISKEDESTLTTVLITALAAGGAEPELAPYQNAYVIWALVLNPMEEAAKMLGGKSVFNQGGVVFDSFTVSYFSQDTNRTIHVVYVSPAAFMYDAQNQTTSIPHTIAVANHEMYHIVLREKNHSSAQTYESYRAEEIIVFGKSIASLERIVADFKLINQDITTRVATELEEVVIPREKRMMQTFLKH